MRRTKDERDDDRAVILAALRDVPDGMTIDELLVQAWNVTEGHGDYWNALSRIRADLNALVKAGQLVSSYLPRQGYALHYRLATLDDLDAESDRAEVARMLRQWEPADGGFNTAAFDIAR